MNYQYKNIEGKKYLEVEQTDYSLIRNPLLNKGSAFTEAEREAFRLHGLIPPAVSVLESQRQRSYAAFKNKTTDLEKYIYLRDLQESNEVLFYSLLQEHVTEMLPIVYTPTVGEGCVYFSHLYRRPRGVFLAYPYKDFIEHILANPEFDLVEVIVVSDGERILGLGDQGVGGMGIPIGKLSLYTACAGIHPAATLPVLLDTGTNNPELVNDPLYMGWRHARIRGPEYEAFVDAFVQAVKKRFPRALLQWEDFAQQNANPLLAKYRDQLCTFNDDIQGTAAVATGALLAAVRATGSRLTAQKIVIVGAGSAGCGIANLMAQAMIEDGLSSDEAYGCFYLIDAQGLLVEGVQHLSFQQPFVQTRARVAAWRCEAQDIISLHDVIKNVQPTVLVGVSGQGGLFTEALVKLMAAQVARPIIFPLSNPNSQAEARPEDLVAWTQGRALIGTGSPFPEIVRAGRSFRVDQTNNSYIFPGVGLGVIAVQAVRVTDKMFMAAARALAACAPVNADPEANLLPPLTMIREVSYKVAVAVAKEAVSAGLAPAMSDEHVASLVQEKMWTPHYLPYMTGF
jgi:malate dehydrogenase (oxaloacetate-decarboxylating)